LSFLAVKISAIIFELLLPIVQLVLGSSVLIVDEVDVTLKYAKIFRSVLTLRKRVIGGGIGEITSRMMRTRYALFGVSLRMLLAGWWNDRKRIHESVLPFNLRLDISSNLSHALSCHKFLVQRMRYDRNRRPCELRICDKCDWHTVQDEEHILLD
jgi:hypothetical protein